MENYQRARNKVSYVVECRGYPVSTGMSYNLANEELFEFRKKSQDGDAEASKKLWLFYEFAVRDNVKAAEWLKKAAEQGLSGAQYNLAFDFSRRGSPRYDLQKAKYWAEKAASNGEQLALRLLREIAELEESDDSK